MADGGADLAIDAAAGADRANGDRAGAGDTTTTAAGDPCVPAGSGYAPESMPNDDRDQATHLALNTATPGCLQAETDVDFYQFTIPSDAQGGFVTISATNLGPMTIVGVKILSASTNGVLDSVASAKVGTSVYAWFPAAAGATFLVSVDYSFSDVVNLGPYTLTAAYQASVEPNEPNDDRAHATPIQSGTSASGMFFSGFVDDQTPRGGDDFFKVTLPVGMASVKLSGVAAELTATLAMYDATGALVTRKDAAAAGADVQLTQAIATAGVYYVDVTCDFAGPAMHGATLPTWATKPYALLVTSQ